MYILIGNIEIMNIDSTARIIIHDLKELNHESVYEVGTDKKIDIIKSESSIDSR